MIKLIRTSLGPLLLMLCCTPFVMLMWFTNTALDGSFYRLGQVIVKDGFFTTLYDIWQPVFFGSQTAWQIIIIFMAFELVLLKCLPGKLFRGPLTPKGNTPIYKSNGLLAFLTSIGTFCLCSFYWHLFSASLIYDHFGEILGAMNLFSLVFCIFLYIKGRYYPSSTDSGLTGNIIFDYYWGTELYPCLAGINLKMFINCRLGMMSWGLILLSYTAKQFESGNLCNSMLIAVALQFVYLVKFYVWETGYLASLDIMHDRAGYYICWGCMVWVPCIYTSPSMYLVLHPIHLSHALAIALLVSGSFCIMINYFADRQRQRVRLTNGHCKVWGKTPKINMAHYKTESGESRQSLLLCSGWWGIARHFHYLPEIAAAFFWSVPALFTHFSPYFYVCFLTILLVDRASRDDLRCYQKYGIDWEQYCRVVPYRIIPFVY